MGNSIYLGGGIKSAFCGGNVKEIYQGTNKLFPSGGEGEIIYLTNFENYNSDTGIDIPKFGGDLSWASADSYKMSGTIEDYESDFIGKSKRFKINSTSYYTAYAKFPLWNELDDISIDFLVSTIFGRNWCSVYFGIYQKGYVQAYSVNDYFGRNFAGWACNRYAGNVWDIEGYSWNNVDWGETNLSDTPNDGPEIRLFGNAISNVNEHHFGCVFSKSKNLYKLFVDGVLVHKESVTKFDELGIMFNANSSVFRISNLCIRKGDYSSGDDEGAIFKVPQKPY